MKKVILFLFICLFILKNEHAQNVLISKSTLNLILSDYIHRNANCYEYKNVKCNAVIKPIRFDNKIYLSFTTIECKQDLPKDITKYYMFSGKVFFIRPFENEIFEIDASSLFIDSNDSVNLKKKSHFSSNCSTVSNPDIYLYRIKRTLVRKSFIRIERKRFWPYESCSSEFWPIDEFYCNVMTDNRFHQIDKELNEYQSSKEAKFTHFKTLRIGNK